MESFYSVVLGFDLRASHLLGRCSTTCTAPPVLFALVILELGVSPFAQADLDHDPPFCIPAIIGMRGVHHHS
jgi:hypothetical protein